VTSDLDEHSIAALRAGPVDSFGVGTSVVTGSGSPAAGFVYKLVARRDDDSDEWMPVAKSSPGKVSRGGAKEAKRLLQGGIATAEHIIVTERKDSDGSGDAGGDEGDGGAAAPVDHDVRQLTVPLMTGGDADPRWLGRDGVRAAREHCAAAVAELPGAALRLSRGEPALPTLTT